MKWYKAMFDTITEVEIERETGKFVVIKGSDRRERKDSDWLWYRPTREEAKACIIASKQAIILELLEQLEYAKDALEKAKAL